MRKNRFLDYMAEEVEDWMDTEDEVQQGEEPSPKATSNTEYEEDDEDEDPVLEIFREILDELSVIRKTLQMMNDKMSGSSYIEEQTPQETAALNKPQSILSQSTTPTLESKQGLDEVNELL